jgi:hypothetical protein
MTWVAAGVTAAGLAAKIGSQYAGGNAKKALDIGGSGLMAGGTMGLGGATAGAATAGGAAAGANAAATPPPETISQVRQAGQQAPQNNPLDWDWGGMMDKAQKFVKVAKDVQNFSAAMKGEPDPNQKISQAAPQQPQQPVQPAQQPMPQTVTQTPMTDQTMEDYMMGPPYYGMY